MDLPKCTSFNDAPSVNMAPANLVNKFYAKVQCAEEEESSDGDAGGDADLDLREVYFLIMHFLSAGPCQRTFHQLRDELMEHELLPRRYHAWYSRNNAHSGEENDDGISFPLNYESLLGRYSHIEKDHLIKLLKQLVLSMAPPFRCVAGEAAPTAADVPTLLGTGTFSLLNSTRDKAKKRVKHLPSYLRWPHMQADQVHGLSLREIGGGFSKHHRAPSIRFACYAIAKPSTMVQKMQPTKKLRGHRNAVYCAIFDRSGRYVITGSDDRLVKIWSMETAFCLASCRGHEGDITDLAVSSNNALVASASNDYSIRVWRLPDGLPISVLKGHTGAVTAIAFSPRPNSAYQLLSSSDDGTCRIWDARYSQCSPRVYLPKPADAVVGKSNGTLSSNMSSSSNAQQGNQILCCAYNPSGTVFVTGSSDTFARVWSALKSNMDIPEKPSHEMDILAGHENDVNYVQFSGCAVAPQSSTSDFIKEENIPKFKNSWFSHDNIVTCSRDGSAIIWIPRLRRSHVKVGRWTRAYHLKVPPPPMPPQPPRGGPRQRFLPTPRGVNMIVWSLDNRFVLAAIMDCRICVWNASDGSLVHSLTGHTASTYVLDVHPFNPRIAMSAGYDGKTIVWDIWEGTPIRVYDIGRFKLVDGKFSQDGTSIVLSDDVGQIYLLNTGQGESQKDAKYDQFFLGDYRPLIQDTHGNVVDQETQLAPYRRNMQDPLCDSSMLPYPEPYQSTYQRRRLGALGIEWRPSTIKFAVGTDIGMGQEYQILPLADLDIAIDPIPEFVDATLWEPENDVINDDTDSEYNVNEEFSSEGGQGCLSDSSSSESEYSEEEMTGPNKRESLRRSKRKKHISEVEVRTSYGRHVKKRMLDEQAGSSSRSKRTKKSRNRHKTSSIRNFAKGKPLRPNRVAMRNANTGFHHISEGSTDAEDGDVSQGVSSDSESSFKGSEIQKKEPGNSTQNEQGKYPRGERELLDEVDNVVKPCKPTESHQVQNENRKRLVVKLSMRNTKDSVVSKITRTQCDKTDAACLTFGSGEGSSGEKWIVSDSGDLGLSSVVEHKEIAENCQNIELGSSKEPDTSIDNNLTSKDGKPRASWGEVIACTSRQMPPGEVMPAHPCNSLIVSSDYHHGKNMDTNHLVRDKDGCRNSGPEMANCVSNECSPLQHVNRTPLLHYPQTGTDSGFSHNLSVSRGGNKHLDPHVCNDKGVSIDQTLEPIEKPKSKKTILKIKPRKNLGDYKDPSKVGLARTEHDPSETTYCIEQNAMLRISETNHGSVRRENMQESYVDMHREQVTTKAKSHGNRINPESNSGQTSENTSQANIPSEEEAIEFPDAATDATRRARSLTLKATSRPTNVLRCNFKMNQGRISSDPSQCPERPAKKPVDLSSLPRWTSTSMITTRSRSSRNKKEGYQDKDIISPVEGTSLSALRKMNWLLLLEQDSYRYIPQLNDEVMYIKQGHQEYMKEQSSSRGPWVKYWQDIRAVEICLVEDLSYASHSGSGESCCEITLGFMDPSSKVVGQKLKLTLPDLIDFPDFLVEKTRYDAAMRRNWTSRDKCVVWWREENEEGGKFWEGRILAVKDKSIEFLGSPWERFQVKYKNDNVEYRLHSPWELHDPDYRWEQPHIDPDCRNKMLSSLTKLRWKSRNEDDCGILKLEEAALKPDFINRFPVPFSPKIIELRLKYNYYRSLEALQHDAKVMLGNGQSYFARNSELSEKMKRLSDWFERTLSKL